MMRPGRADSCLCGRVDWMKSSHLVYNRSQGEVG
jgi:hypothetical protein